MDTTGALFLIAASWMLIGVSTAVVMGRRGHHAWSWLVIAAVLGPLAIPLALTAGSDRTPTISRVLSGGSPGPGEVSVLVGIDGSEDAVSALHAAIDLLGPRVGRVMLAGVLDRDTARTPSLRDDERHALEALRAAAAEVTSVTPGTIVLEGPPSRVLAERAVSDGYDLLVVGRRGSGASKSLMGSVASTLSRGCGVPILIV